MRRLLTACFCVAALGAAGISTAALGQAAPAAAPAAKPVQVKGSLVSIEGDKLVVKDAAGASTAMTLAADARVIQLKKIDISAIQPGSYVATANMDLPDGGGRSTELRVFPPAMKGLGEGHYVMNDGSGAMMTNGTVTSQVMSTPRGREMDVGYDTTDPKKGGKGVRHIVVPNDMVIREMTIMDKVALKPGIAVVIAAVPGADGALVARRVLIGENGAPPVL